MLKKRHDISTTDPMILPPSILLVCRRIPISHLPFGNENINSPFPNVFVVQ